MCQKRYQIKSYCAGDWGVGEEGSVVALKQRQTFINHKEITARYAITIIFLLMVL